MPRCLCTMVLACLFVWTVRAADSRRDGLTRAEAFAADWMEAARGWKGSKEIEAFFKTEGRKSYDPSRALRLIAGLAVNEKAAIGALEAPLRDRLLSHLDAIDRRDPTARLQALELVERLGPDRAAAVPLILRGMTDDDPKIAQVAGRVGAKTFEDDTLHWETIAAVADAMIDPNPKVASAAAKVAAGGAPDRTLNRCICDSLVKAAARNEFGALHLLKERKIPSTMFAHSARVLGGGTYGVLHALRLAEVGPLLDEDEKLRDFVIGWLRSGDAAVCGEAARLFVTGGSRAIAMKEMAGVIIKHGDDLPPAMLKQFKPDPEEFGAALIDVVRRGPAGPRRAALRALAVVGVKGEVLEKTVTEFLRSSDAELRHDAGRALGTREAIAISRMPDVLNDLRSDDISVRRAAAVEFRWLETEPAAFAEALLRVVNRGDMPAREGLLLGIERGFQTRTPAGDVIKTLAETGTDLTARAYARAALRELAAK